MIRIRRRLFQLVAVIIITMLFGLQPHTIAWAAYTVADSANLTPDAGYWWGTSNDVNALFGSVKYTNQANATLSWSFNGSRVAYLYSMAYNRGSTIVTIDGTLVDILDSYAPHVNRQVGKIYTLNSGNHTITIKNNSAGANNRVIMDVDAFVSDIVSFPTNTYNDDASLWISGVHYWPLGYFGNNWTTVSDGSAYGGEYKKTTSTGAGFRINFEGDSIYWYYPLRSDLGKIDVMIDGDYWAEKDPYQDQTGYYSLSRLGAGPHILTVTNTGETSSGGHVLALDKFVVGSTYTAYNRVMAAAYADARVWNHNVFWFNYYDGNDCANFSSQMQYMGGIPMHPVDNPYLLNPYDLTQWYSYLVYGDGSSLTWRVVESFRTYEQNHSGFQIETGPITNLRRGDVIFYDVYDSGVYDHMKVVSGRGYTSPYLDDYHDPLPGWYDESGQYIQTVLTDGHTYDRWHVRWDYSFPSDYPHIFLKVVP